MKAIVLTALLYMTMTAVTVTAFAGDGAEIKLTAGVCIL
jgi:hypothetical protein